jgi:hypothetical protein
MHRRLLSTALAIAGVLVCIGRNPGAIVPAGEKMKPEDLVARHVESIGSAEARAAAKNRVISGDAQVTFRLGSRGQLVGKSSILSEGRRFRLGMSFANQNYPGEDLVFDGKGVTAATIRSGVRSNLSDFIYRYDFLLKEGLVGGVTSTGWFLLDIAGRAPRLAYGGLKKIDGKSLHELKYQGGKGAGTFQIFFYFDPGTFQHVLSLYALRVPAFPAKTLPDLTQDQLEGFYRLREEFGAFKTVDGLTLPHSYKLVLTIEGQSQTFLADWNIVIAQILHNQQLDDRSFIVQPTHPWEVPRAGPPGRDSIDQRRRL